MPKARRLFAFLAIGSLMLIGLMTCASPNEPSQSGSDDLESDLQHSPTTMELSEGALLGRWESPTNEDAYVEFVAFGLWVASDGCDSLTGTWWIDDDGELHAGSNGKRSEGQCDGVDIPRAIVSAQSTLIDVYGNLVFVDQDGTRTALVPGS